MNIRASHFLKSSAASATVAVLMKAESLWALAILIKDHQIPSNMDVGLIDLIQWVAIFVITFFVVYKYLDMREKIIELKDFRDHEMRRLWRHISYRHSVMDDNMEKVIGVINSMQTNTASLTVPNDLATQYRTDEVTELNSNRIETYNSKFAEWGLSDYKEVYMVTKS